MTDSFVVRPGAGRHLDLGTFQAEVLAAGEQTAGEFSLLLTQDEPPGFGPPLHLHRDAAEAFYCRRGRPIYLADRQERRPAGTFVYVPRNTPHTFEVVSSTPGRKLNLFTPAAMVGFFEELAEAEGSGRATPELLDAIAERNSRHTRGGWQRRVIVVGGVALRA